MVAFAGYDTLEVVQITGFSQATWVPRMVLVPC